jgi:hypothetical protein
MVDECIQWHAPVCSVRHCGYNCVEDLPAGGLGEDGFVEYVEGSGQHDLVNEAVTLQIQHLIDVHAFDAVSGLLSGAPDTGLDHCHV